MTNEKKIENSKWRYRGVATPVRLLPVPPMRVRNILDGLKGTGRRPLLKHVPLPPLPENREGRFPYTLLTVLPQDTRHSIIGRITEALVLGTQPLTVDSIQNELVALGCPLDAAAAAKVTKSKTTTDYLQKIQATRTALQGHLQTTTKEDKPIIQQNQELQKDSVEGHPDGICSSTVLEVKTTSKLETDLPYFMLQLFAYVSLGDFQYAMLVLPLQQTVLVLDARTWPARAAYHALLNKGAQKLQQQDVQKQKQEQEQQVVDILPRMEGARLMQTYGIGCHIAKRPTMLETVQQLPPHIPHQIFMGGNQTSRLSLKDADLLAANNHVQEHHVRYYVHSPYLLNLSSTTEDNWQIEYLKKLLQAAHKAGAKGVVVHVGKHTKQSYEDGVKAMKHTIQQVLPAATEACPFLLETPAGQGTETLQAQEEFLDFVESFQTPTIRACVDTCHVFANGHDPFHYVQAAHQRGLLRLIHFNDSQECCGGCKDRHAQIGGGKIGLPTLRHIAEYGAEHHIDMLYE